MSIVEISKTDVIMDYIVNLMCFTGSFIVVSLALIVISLVFKILIDFDTKKRA